MKQQQDNVDVQLPTQEDTTAKDANAPIEERIGILERLMRWIWKLFVFICIIGTMSIIVLIFIYIIAAITIFVLFGGVLIFMANALVFMVDALARGIFWLAQKIPVRYFD